MGPAPGDRVFLRVERYIYRLCRIDPATEQRWTTYAYTLLGSASSRSWVYVLQRVQGSLPVNPAELSAVVPHLSFNTAVSS